MELDMELVYGEEDYEALQEYFEHRKYSYPSGSLSMSERLESEYIPDVTEDYDERDKISNRQKAIRRVWESLEKISSNE